MGSMLILHIQLIAIDRYTKFLVMAISEPGKGKKKKNKDDRTFRFQVMEPALEPSVSYLIPVFTSVITSPPVHLYHCDL